MKSDQMVRSALLRLKFLDSHKYSGELLWAAASDLFGTGSTTAIALCRRHGLNPDERLPDSSMSKTVKRCVKECEDEEQSPAETCCKMLSVIEELSARSL